MRKSLGVLLGTVLLLGLSASAFAKGGGSNPQFPAPTPASYYVEECLNEFIIEWTPVVSNVNGSSPTKYAIQIVQTLRDGCPEGNIVGTKVDNFTAPGNASQFTTPPGTLQFPGPPGACGPDDVVILVKALNPPGKSQNNPQAVAEFEAFGVICGP